MITELKVRSLAGDEWMGLRDLEGDLSCLEGGGGGTGIGVATIDG